MNDHSNRILNRILELISKYRNNEISLAYLVDAFIGSIDAIEEPLLEDWRDRWLKKMVDLDTYVALELETERKSDILEDLVEVEQLIHEITSIQ